MNKSDQLRNQCSAWIRHSVSSSEHEKLKRVGQVDSDTEGYRQKKNDLQEAIKNDEWVVEAYEIVIRQTADKMYEFTTGLLELAESEDVISSIGAGPMEDLLNDFGPEVIDRLVKDSRKNGRFRDCLSSVNTSGIDASVWNQLAPMIGRGGE